MHSQDIDYRNEAETLRGHLVYDETSGGPRPGVLVFHEGLGLGDFAIARARRPPAPMRMVSAGARCWWG